MKITGYRSLTTQQEWHRPVGDVNGVSSGTRTEVHVLIVTTDVGLEGVSVSAASHADIDRVFPAVLGEDPRTVVALYDRMIAFVFKSGHSGGVFATIGAVDQALWDLKAKAADEPLWRLLGGAQPWVPGYASGLDFALDDMQLTHLYERFAAVGFSQAKVKGGQDLESDIRRLKIVRNVMARNSAQPALMFDANESWHRSQAVRQIRAMETEVDITWVEEPVRRWDAAGLADVRRSVATGIATGENLTGLEQYRPIIQSDGVDIVQFNGGSGITHALRVATIAHAHDLPVSPVGFTSVVAHAVTAMPNHLTTEVQALDHPIGIHLDQRLVDGGILLGETPGAGITVDETFVSELPRTPGWGTLSGPHVRPERAGLRLVPETVAGPTAGTGEAHG